MATQASRQHGGFRNTVGDATGNQLALLLRDDYKVLHVASAADAMTDWNVAAPTHPTLYVHSETTPATDYMSFSHDGDAGTITVAGGTLALNGVTSLALQVGGTSEVTLTATALSPTTSDGSALGTSSLMWGDLFLATGAVINFNNDDVTVTHAADVVTVANATAAATGRALKVSATYAAAALTDGYGAHEVDVTLSGSPTDHSAASSSWVNITGGTVPAGTYICARNDGIYEEAAATVTNAKIIFGARMQYIFSDTDALRFPFSLNTGNAGITAMWDCNNVTDFGTVANAGSSAATLLPLLRDAGGTLKYVLLYDLQ